MKLCSRIHPSSSQLAFLGAACMFFSMVELSIPRFVPFFRLGLSNLPLLVALSMGMDFSGFLCLLGLKLISQAVVSGTLFSYVFVLSLAAAVSSGLVMYGLSLLLNRKGLFSLSLLGVSVAGALASNTAQCLVATLFLGRQAMLLFFPVAGLGLVTSVLLGLASNAFVSNSKFPSLFCSAQPQVAVQGSVVNDKRRSSSLLKKAAAVLMGLMMVSIFMIDSLWYKGGVLAFTMAVLLAVRCKVHPVRTIVLIVSVSLLSLFSPYGRVLFSIGQFDVTLGALEHGLSIGLGLACTMGLSRLIMLCLDLAGKGMLALLLVYVGQLGEQFALQRKIAGWKPSSWKTAADVAVVKVYRGDIVD